MAKYLLQGTYISEAWAAQVRNPQNRVEEVRSVIARLGGRLESTYLAFGEYDVVAIVEMPDNELVASFTERSSLSHWPRCRATASYESGAARKMHGTP